MGNDSMQSTRETLHRVWNDETATTLRVIKAYPADQSELTPHPRSKSARELIWMFSLEMTLASAAIRGEMDLSGGFPPAPATFDEVVSSFEATRANLLETLKSSTDEQLGGTVRFFTAPKTMGDVPTVGFLWFILHDQIHHRGQLSVYLRMSGAKVPSIYGPSADEPWY